MSQSLPRTVLPIPPRPYVGVTTYDAKDPDTSFPPIEPLRPPAGSPNVLIILIDDCGFGASSTFGGPCETPVADRLAADGLRYTRFHTTALCSPTRAALLSGRNHHTVGMGGITEIATSAPGNSSIRPLDCAPLAETLRLNGYSTAQIGKCHEVPVWEVTSAGPFDRWPTGSGFEYFYGFIAGETNNFFPALYEGTTPIEPPSTPAEGYHLSEDLADRAISWLEQQSALAPDKPFFMYFAPGATHAPHLVPDDWRDKYVGKFDAGWDVQRAETFERQKALGVIPADAVLTERPDEIPAWDDMPDELKPILARQMEVYAAYLDHADHHIGRVVDSIERMGALEDTLVYYIIGDNGASAEGTLNGTFNELLILNGIGAMETPEFMASHVDDFGTPDGYNHYSVGWAHAMDTPYQWTKQVASHFGGTRNGTVVHWPAGVENKGEIRHQFSHVIDVAATVLDVVGLPAPDFVNGIQQRPLEGSSMKPSFNDADVPEYHETQYFEMFGNRGIYHKGWTAVTRHSTPWVVGTVLPEFDDDNWELYDTNVDWTQSHDLAAEQPEKLHQLQRLFIIEATKYNVLPLDDRRVERFDSDQAGRPTLISGTSQLLYGSMTRLSENAVLNTKNKSHSVTAEVTVPEGGGHGVIIAQGGAFGGWALYLIDGVPRYCYNALGLQRFTVVGTEAVPAGTHQVRVEFAYDGGGLAKGGTATLYIDGEPVGSGRVGMTVPLLFSADETTDLGGDTATPVSEDYTPETSRFTGKIAWVQIDLGDVDEDHLITADDKLRVAMSRQ